MYFLGLMYVALAAIVAATPLSSRHEVHEKRRVSPNWEKRDRLHAAVKLPMRIGLTQRNLDNSYEYLMNVCVHPNSLFSYYGWI
jgi:tripeptidyl-peptidase-1